jgi:hypothetical protein
MFYFLDKQAEYQCNLICNGSDLTAVFSEGLEKIAKYHKNYGPFGHYVITKGYKGPIVWETVPADVKDRDLSKPHLTF